MIDDALKRAQEAGGGEARPPGDRPWVPTPMPDPGLARGRMLRRAAAIALVALAACGGAYLLVRGSASDAPAGGTRGVAAPERAAAPTELPLVLVIVPTPPSSAKSSAAPAGVVAPSTIGSTRPRPDAARPAPPVAHTVAATAEPRAPRLAAGKTYAGSVTLPGGEKIELGGIVWSEADPRALLNDRIVGVGGYVEGYTVSRIETDRVELQKDGVSIFVSVK